MKIINGDLLKIESGMICHQVNCRGVANLGLAKQVRDNFPNWYRTFRSPAWGELGDVWYFPASDKLTIANMYAQKYYGHNKRHTNYEAFYQCLEKIQQEIDDTLVYFPFGIGCGLAGGNWNIVSKMIEVVLPNATIVRKT